MIAEKLGISIVTVRHYMNYLIKQLTGDINCCTGERPGMLYKKKKFSLAETCDFIYIRFIKGVFL